MLKLNHIEEELIKDCSNESLSQKEVCEKYGISITAIRTFLKHKGLKWVAKPDPKKVIFSEDQIEYCIKEWLEGKSLDKLAVEFNCKHTVISKVLRKNGLDTSLEKKHRDVLETVNKNKEKIIEFYTVDRLSGHAIGAIYGIAGCTIYRYLDSWGIQVVDRNKRLDVRENKDKIIKMYEDNYAISVICEIFKCDYNCIKICFEEWGLDLNKKRVGVGTYIENKVEKFLIEANITHEKQFKLERSKFDFYIPEANLFIETHGDYWHGNPKMYSELDDIQKFKKDLDKKKRKMAKIYGYNYIWIWGADIKNNFEKVKVKILNSIKKFSK